MAPLPSPDLFGIWKSVVCDIEINLAVIKIQISHTPKGNGLSGNGEVIVPACCSIQDEVCQNALFLLPPGFTVMPCKLQGHVIRGLSFYHIKPAAPDLIQAIDLHG